MLATLVRQLDDTPNDLPSLPDLFLVNAIFSGRELTAIADDLETSISELEQRVSGMAVKLFRGAVRVTEIMDENRNAV